MESLLDQISQIAKKINLYETLQQKISDSFLAIKDLIYLNGMREIVKNNILEEFLFKKILPISLNGLRIIGVDGGLINKSYNSIDLILLRGVACIFEYKGEKPQVEYITSQFPIPEIKTSFSPFSRVESEIYGSLERIKCELDIAIKAIEKKRPDLLLLDGSILPVPSDKPSQNSILYKIYKKVVNKYEELYECCLEKQILLAGCIKDTRSRRFMNLFLKLIPQFINKYPKFRKILELDYRQVLNSIKDSDFLFRVMKEGERTSSLSFSDDINMHPILKDIDDKFSKHLNLFYLKNVARDLPIRVEYLNINCKPISTIDKIARSILSISNYYQDYGFPVPLIEADARAKLSEYDLEVIYNILNQNTLYPSSLLKLRRNRGPI
ncbi:MAG: DNA double-strand break repair nuclease NurA [Candidatus Lokiarchaeota archaeon]|nr:DNA double-strand break repair nuclease NurA [Candidatus Lokiarchaeota archaeon]